MQSINEIIHIRSEIWCEFVFVDLIFTSYLPYILKRASSIWSERLMTLILKSETQSCLSLDKEIWFSQSRNPLLKWTSANWLEFLLGTDFHLDFSKNTNSTLRIVFPTKSKWTFAVVQIVWKLQKSHFLNYELKIKYVSKINFNVLLKLYR